MMRRNWICILLLSVVVSFSLGPFCVPLDAAAPKLSSKKITVEIGQKKKVKLKNAKKATWAVVSGKDKIEITKNKKSVVILGKKAGTSKIRAKANGKTLYCTVTVKKPPITSEDGGSPSVSVTPGEGYGASVVAFARQFVGNPYKWGGTSLTEGCDCSGFVYAVYKSFGIDYGRLTSDGFLEVGQAVSYENIQAGDVVVYSGHVAIYDGEGGIVEAQSSTAGITNNRAVNCKPILGIRRLI